MDTLAATTGIDHQMEARLAALGIANTHDFLHHARTQHARRELARRLGVTQHHVLRWAHRADLARILGLGATYIHLLTLAGIPSVKALAQYEPLLLVDLLQRVNKQRHIVRRLPTTEAVSEWVAQARRLECALLDE